MSTCLVKLSKYSPYLRVSARQTVGQGRVNNSTTVVHDKTSFSVWEETKNTSQIISFLYEWGRIKDPRPNNY